MKPAEEQAIQGRPPQPEDVCPDKGKGKGAQNEEGLEFCEVQEHIEEGNETAAEVNELTSRLEGWKQHPPLPFFDRFTRLLQVLPVADFLDDLLDLPVFLDHTKEVLGLHKARLLSAPIEACLFLEGPLHNLV